MLLVASFGRQINAFTQKLLLFAGCNQWLTLQDYPTLPEDYLFKKMLSPLAERWKTNYSLLILF
jgi:hypothetical protein